MHADRDMAAPAGRDAAERPCTMIWPFWSRVTEASDVPNITFELRLSNLSTQRVELEQPRGASQHRESSSELRQVTAAPQLEPAVVSIDTK